jgi:hypothetical protein
VCVSFSLKSSSFLSPSLHYIYIYTQRKYIFICANAQEIGSEKVKVRNKKRGDANLKARILGLKKERGSSSVRGSRLRAQELWLLKFFSFVCYILYLIDNIYYTEIFTFTFITQIIYKKTAFIKGSDLVIKI